MSVVLVSHQPQFLPYLGLYNKILKSDKFMFLDDVQFNNSSWHARTIIKNHQDKTVQLIIPCSTRNSSSKYIKDIVITDDRWKRKHLKTIETIYKKTKNFDEIFNIIKQIISIKSNYLIDYTIPSMSIFLEKLGYSKKQIFIQSKEEKVEGDKNEFLINLTKKFNGSVYLSGLGGKNYIDEKKFTENNIVHKFNNFKHPEYTQFGKKFVPQLSIIDAAFNIGTTRLKKLIS